MATFEYTARNSQGSTVDGTIDAADQVHAAQTLRSQGLTPSRIQESSSGASSKKRGRRGRVKLEDMVIFSRQLAVMIQAGLPLIEVLNILSEQLEKASFQEIMRQVEADVESGSSFTEALQKHPSIFSPFFLSMIRAGEAAGMLDTILNQVATYLEKTASLTRKVKGAMVYPIVVLSFAGLITIFLMIKVVPVFEQIFEDLEGELPLITQATVAISNLLVAKGVYLLVVFIAMIIAIRYWGKTDKGRRTLDRIKISLPVVGPLILKAAVAKFSRTLGVLLRAGVNILSALDIVATTSGNSVIEDAINRTKISIQNGETISKPLEEANVFPPMVTRMINVGERTGNLESMLHKIADFYDDQVDAAVSALTSLIEPILIVVLGVLVGTIVISMFMPMFKMLEHIA